MLLKFSDLMLVCFQNVINYITWNLVLIISSLVYLTSDIQCHAKVFICIELLQIYSLQPQTIVYFIGILYNKLSHSRICLLKTKENNGGFLLIKLWCPLVFKIHCKRRISGAMLLVNIVHRCILNLQGTHWITFCWFAT